MQDTQFRIPCERTTIFSDADGILLSVYWFGNTLTVAMASGDWPLGTFMLGKVNREDGDFPPLLRARWSDREIDSEVNGRHYFAIDKGPTQDLGKTQRDQTFI